MSNRVFAIVFAIPLLIIVWGCYRVFSDEDRTLDGTGGVILKYVLKDSTVFADGYSASAFDKIKVGDSETEVLATLGEPIRKWTTYYRSESADTQWWCYAHSPKDSHYRIRQIGILNGQVLGKTSGFYVD